MCIISLSTYIHLEMLSLFLAFDFGGISDSTIYSARVCFTVEFIDNMAFFR